MADRLVSPSVRGYVHPEYAASLGEFGKPRSLPRSGGSILERSIEGFTDRDAIGCYPIFCCRDWSQLIFDLEESTGGLLSLTLVADPFGRYDETYLRECFKDLVVPFKRHFIADLNFHPNEFVAASHRRKAKLASNEVNVDRCAIPKDFLNNWIALYEVLIKRHQIHGIARFSREAFAKQLSIPGIVAFRAARTEAIIGMVLWYVQGDVAYYHLGAYSKEGYEHGASFALFWRAIEYFQALGLRWLSLGASAGIEDEDNGLTRFKRGWSNGMRTAFLCGRIFDHRRYEQVCAAKAVSESNYFPAYRHHDFRCHG